MLIALGNPTLVGTPGGGENRGPWGGPPGGPPGGPGGAPGAPGVYILEGI